MSSTTKRSKTQLPAASKKLKLALPDNVSTAELARKFSSRLEINCKRIVGMDEPFVPPADSTKRNNVKGNQANAALPVVQPVAQPVKQQEDTTDTISFSFNFPDYTLAATRSIVVTKPGVHLPSRKRDVVYDEEEEDDSEFDEELESDSEDEKSVLNTEDRLNSPFEPLLFTTGEDLFSGSSRDSGESDEDSDLDIGFDLNEYTEAQQTPITPPSAVCDLMPMEKDPAFGTCLTDYWSSESPFTVPELPDLFLNNNNNRTERIAPQTAEVAEPTADSTAVCEEVQTTTTEEDSEKSSEDALDECLDLGLADDETVPLSTLVNGCRTVYKYRFSGSMNLGLVNINPGPIYSN